MNEFESHLSPFGFLIHQVPVGTIITDPVTGEKCEVTETSVIMSRRACWVTPPQYDAIKLTTAPTTRL